MKELGKQVRSWVRGESVQPEPVSAYEHAADEIKREIRSYWAKKPELVFAQDRLLELLWHQDEIADLAQDAALLLALRRPALDLALEDAFRALGELLEKVVHGYAQAITTFENAWSSGTAKERGPEISSQLDLVHRLEHESDLLEREIVATIYARQYLEAFDRYHLIQVVLVLGDLVDQVENAAEDLALLMVASQ